MRLRIIIIFALMFLAFSDSAFATGDCNGDNTVTIDEVQSSINMFLGLITPNKCVDEDNSGTVTIAEVQSTINTFLGLTDITPPTLNSFTLPAAAASLTVAVTGLSASDIVGVTGYLITESATAPAATATGWSATAPKTFTFSNDGSRTAYAWAKDAAGNVSSSRAASTTITLPDVTPPTLISFTLPATAASLTVAVTSLSASDAVGVTGYLITETAATPAATAPGWSATAPTTFTFTDAGIRTAHAWAKDAAGNVSSSLSGSASTTITLPTTKTATLKFSSQSTNPNELIGGFLLTVELPVGSVLPVDAVGIPLSSAVYLSGEFEVGPPPLHLPPDYCPITYDIVSRTLEINPFSTNEYNVGELLTVIINVPISYELKTSDIKTSFKAWSPSGAGPLETVTVTFTFN